MNKRLELMTRAFVDKFNEDRGDAIYPESILIWLNYVKTGKTSLSGIGSLSESYLKELETAIAEKK